MFKYSERLSRDEIDLSDEQMFKELFLGYFAPLCVFAKGFVGNFNDEDIVSSVFLKLYQQGKKFDNIDDFVFYLYRSVRNKCLDSIKSNNRMSERNQIFCDDLKPDDLFEQILENEMLAETYREIRSLPTCSKKIIELSYLEGRSNQEIADELQLSLQTVKNYKHRAVSSLKIALLKKIVTFLVFVEYFSEVVSF